MLTKITQSQRPQNTLRYCMQQRICIGMPKQSQLMLDFHASQNQLSSFYQLMYTDTSSYIYIVYRRLTKDAIPLVYFTWKTNIVWISYFFVICRKILQNERTLWYY